MANPRARLSPPRFLIKAVLSLYRRLQAVADAAVPAPLALVDRAFGVQKTALLHVAARLAIADHLASGPKTAAELAQLVEVDADALHRALRGLATLGVFTLDGAGRFANNRLSEPMRSDVPGSVRHFLVYVGARSTIEAYADFFETVRTGKNAFARVHAASVWDWFAAHPEEGAEFSAAMNDATLAEAAAIAGGYAFGDVGRICDVGGGRGSLLAEVLHRHPSARGVLFDAAAVLGLAEEVLGKRGVRDRVELVAGNFFASVPDDCDGYVLKDILHDWDDARAVSILKNCRKAARKGARVFIVEALVERNDADIPGSLADLHMMTVCGEGRQRSAAEHDALLERAGFVPERVVTLPALASLVVGVA